MVIADQNTKWVEAFAVPNQSSETTAWILVEESNSTTGSTYRPKEGFSEQNV
jgi:hypothetical protein